MTENSPHLVFIGRVESSLTDLSEAPRQADEGAPPAQLVIFDEYAAAAAEILVGDDVVVLTWLDRSDRSVLRTRPRSDPGRPVTGVFSTRSPERPNPIGLHPAKVIRVAGSRIEVDRLEAIDGTPIIDLKPRLR